MPAGLVAGGLGTNAFVTRGLGAFAIAGLTFETGWEYQQRTGTRSHVTLAIRQRGHDKAKRLKRRQRYGGG